MERLMFVTVEEAQFFKLIPEKNTVDLCGHCALQKLELCRELECTNGIYVKVDLTELSRKLENSEVDISKTIDALILDGKKIPAIKMYRAHHECDLRTAKSVIEARVEELELELTGGVKEWANYTAAAIKHT